MGYKRWGYKRWILSGMHIQVNPKHILPCNVAPPVVSSFINPIYYSYKYNKP